MAFICAKLDLSVMFCGFNRKISPSQPACFRGVRHAGFDPPRRRKPAAAADLAQIGRAAAVGLTREAVVDAALRLMNETGVAGFSVRELARRLGVSPAAIYHHLGGSKHDLFAELASRITTDLMDPGEVREDWRWTIKELLYRYRTASL
ncbi:helix-turn-helix domain-containing protein [Salipiger sp. 1_MG-2023]|uniref:TetR/AcrR family transcriptional regulator n=1 Tax=Salipiger sp. 1_MG-2023 TaxID=3062665 RepID=UPI0026E39DFD|nr:helix-turn-helix domain-containing protein [Salipiger sp. 1_MG-2023]MDO6587213.1 helix-turn-helix domain-containing protein [Salipiger sp. 1_MG-2023]